MTSVVTVDNAPDEGRTAEQQKYLDDVAAAAKRAVAHVEQTIVDLEASLEERRAEAKRAQAEADADRYVDEAVA